MSTRRFTDFAGVVPDHLDAHQFIANLHPPAFATMLELADCHRIPVRNAVMFLDVDAFQRFVDSRGCVQFADLPRLVEALQDVYARRPATWPDFFEYRFYDSYATAEMLSQIIAELPPGTTEIMCHPGYADGLDDFYRKPREAEVAALTSDSAWRAIDDWSVELIDFRLL